MEELYSLIRKLRGPSGCPWDRAQDSKSLAPFLLEEAYETSDAIYDEDEDRLKEELGDLLLHLIFQAQLAEERHAFRWEDIVSGITDKMIRRHASVLNGEANGEQPEDWEIRKKEEKGRKSLLDGIPRVLPALLRAWRIQQRAAEVGFDWPDSDAVWEKVLEEIEEVQEEIENGDMERLDSEIGDLLFAIVSFARHNGLEAESVLRRGIERFTRRFQAMEQELDQSTSPLGTVSLDEMDTIWEKVKAHERSLSED